ncbi:unnamed protein product, partial [Phaeothamnion confervicola]
WQSLVDIGDVYALGGYPRFLPNEALALNCYRTACQCPDPTVAGLAQSKFVTLRLQKIHEIDRSGTHLPEGYGVEACKLAKELLRQMPYMSFNKPRSSLARLNLHRHHRAPVQALAQAPVQVPPIARVRRVPRLDTQNVHDHSIVSAVRVNIDALNARNTIVLNTKACNRALEQVRHAILSCNPKELNGQQKGDALLVLDKLSDSTHTGYNVSDLETLALVWNEISKHDQQAALTETLCKQLASGVENGFVVCLSGRISRIVSALDGTGLLTDAVPM